MPNKIKSSRLHAPPPLPVPSTSTDPLSRSKRLSLKFAKNPIDRLSGDQNGRDASAVHGGGRGEPVSSGRNQSFGLPSDGATKTSAFPSGDTASENGSLVGGVVTSRRSSAGTRGDLLMYQTLPAAPAATRS